MFKTEFFSLYMEKTSLLRQLLEIDIERLEMEKQKVAIESQHHQESRKHKEIIIL